MSESYSGQLSRKERGQDRKQPEWIKVIHDHTDIHRPKWSEINRNYPKCLNPKHSETTRIKNMLLLRHTETDGKLMRIPRSWNSLKFIEILWIVKSPERDRIPEPIFVTSDQMPLCVLPIPDAPYRLCMLNIPGSCPADKGVNPKIKVSRTI